MRKLQLLLITSMMCSVLFSQPVIHTSSLQALPGDGIIRKQLLSAQSGNAVSRIQTANITWVADPSMPPPANFTAALDEACRIWGERIISNIPIKFKVQCVAGGSMAVTQQILLPGNFPPLGTGAYPQALYNKLANVDDNGATEEFIIRINTNYTYFTGINGVGITGSQYDLLTVLLHEIGHGLGFASMVGYLNPYYGFYSNTAYKLAPIDAYIEDFLGTQLMRNLTNNTPEFNAFVFGKNAFFKGTNAVVQNYNIPVKVWASDYPTNLVKSIISHLDEGIFKDGQNSLMSPAITGGEVIHDIGNTTLGILDDIGWDVNYIIYNVGLQIGKMNGSTFTTSGLSTNLCESISGYTFAVQPTQNNGSTVTIPNGNVYWNLFAYHKDGKENMLDPSQPSGNASSNISLTVRTPFPSKNWIYNADGTILGELRCTAIGSDGNAYGTSLRVAITQKPDMPVVSSYCCSGKQYVNYATPRATTYEVYRNNTLIYTGSNTSYNFTPIRGFSYSFYVKAINCAATLTSAIINKSCWDCNGVWCAFVEECGTQSSRLINPVEEQPAKAETIPFYTTAPGQRQLHIGIPSVVEDLASYTVSLISMEGKILYHNTLSRQDIDISRLSKGIYIIHILQGNKQVYKNKIAVE